MRLNSATCEALLSAGRCSRTACVTATLNPFAVLFAEPLSPGATQAHVGLFFRADAFLATPNSFRSDSVLWRSAFNDSRSSLFSARILSPFCSSSSSSLFSLPSHLIFPVGSIASFNFSSIASIARAIMISTTSAPSGSISSFHRSTILSSSSLVIVRSPFLCNAGVAVGALPALDSCDAGDTAGDLTATNPASSASLPRHPPGSRPARAPCTDRPGDSSWW